MMTALDRLTSGMFLSNDKACALADEQIEALRIKTGSRDSAVRTLSGGNQQKVVLAKWLATNPAILVLDEPTAGIDIGSKSEIIQLVRELARAGAAIIMISSELSEMVSACDRIVVMSAGRVMADMTRDDLDERLGVENDSVVRLQAAEQKLQLAIQKALTKSEASDSVH
jgi:ribose transport system ATP-binding protein